MILDTNTYTALRRRDSAVLDRLKISAYITIPFVVIAELQYGFLNGNRTAYNQAMLEDFLAQPTVRVMYAELETCTTYASLRLHAQQAAWALSNNDIWIAAITYQSDDMLVTYDQAFIVFQELLGHKLVILSRS